MKLKLRALDKILFIYIFINILIILLGWNKITHPVFTLLVFMGIGFFIFFINWIFHKKKLKFLEIIRDFYPVLFFLYFFEASTAINKIIFPDFIDPFFQKIDLFIFGYQPALIWGKVLDNYFWQEIFHFAYFSYYLIPFLFLTIYLKKRELFSQFVFIITFVFLLCYLTFSFLPVIGGRWWEIKEGFPSLTTEYRYGIFTRIMAFIYRTTPHQGGAFPSSHVAVAVVANIISFKFNKKLGWIILPITILLIISTVHCHYHYFIDTVFGVIYGVVFYFLGFWLYRKLS